MANGTRGRSRPLSGRSWLAHFWRRTPEEELTPTRLHAGWEPLPDDIAEWMGMNPYTERRSA